MLLSYLQVLRVANNDSDAEISELPWALARPSSKTNSKADSRRNINFKYRIDELNEPPPRSPGIRSLLPLPGGDLLTGGTDLKIRRWDHCRFLLFSPFNHLVVSSYIVITTDLCVFINDFCVFINAAQSELTAYVAHLLRELEMTNFMKPNPVSGCKLCRYVNIFYFNH